MVEPHFALLHIVLQQFRRLHLISDLKLPQYPARSFINMNDELKFGSSIQTFHTAECMRRYRLMRYHNTRPDGAHKKCILTFPLKRRTKANLALNLVFDRAFSRLSSVKSINHYLPRREIALLNVRLQAPPANSHSPLNKISEQINQIINSSVDWLE